jgi:hypothetical protein
MQRLVYVRSAYRRTISAVERFIRVYRPHAVREDIKLFAKLRGLVSEHEYDAMCQLFESKEDKLRSDVDLRRCSTGSWR